MTSGMVGVPSDPSEALLTVAAVLRFVKDGVHAAYLHALLKANATYIAVFKPPPTPVSAMRDLEASHKFWCGKNWAKLNLPANY